MYAYEIVFARPQELFYVRACDRASCTRRQADKKRKMGQTDRYKVKYERDRVKWKYEKDREKQKGYMRERERQEKEK